MGKPQVWIALFLVGAIALLIVSETAAAEQAYQGHPIQAVQTVNPLLPVYIIGSFIGLELLSDVAPGVATGIAGLLFAGALLRLPLVKKK